MNKLKSISFILGVVMSVSGFNAVAAPVNVNSASADQIASSLTGVGNVKAQAIVDHCKQITCSKPEDLLTIKGIGEKTLAKIADDLRFKDE